MEDERKAVLKLINSSFFRSFIDSQHDMLEKNPEKSEIMRQAGNDIYKNRAHNSQSHTGVWVFYTGSISTAKLNTEGLAMGYGNRSALLLHLNKYEASLRDIDRALNITTSDSLKIKLLLRKAKCLHVMGLKDNENILKKVKLLQDRITNINLKTSVQTELDKVNFLLRKPAQPKKSKDNNEAMNSLNKRHKLDDFSSVELQFDDKYGRHLVAAKDIRPGEVIYIETPYVQYVDPGKKHAYCSHCFATVWDNIPCDHCSSDMFCSEKCKKQAWKNYHDMDCSVYAAFDMNTNDSYRQLALKIICRALKKFGGIENLKVELSALDDCSDYKEGFVHDGKLQAQGLKSIYLLCKNVPTDTLKNHEEKTASILESFATHTMLFGEGFDSTNPESYKNNENAIFLGSLFLRLSKISQLNAFQMWNRTHKCTHNFNEHMCFEMQCCAAGAYIAPITGLLNHDCFPNAGRCYTSEHTVLLYAIKPIKKGTQIFTSYSETFLDETLASRKKYLANRYNFRCDCFSCERKWETGFKRIHDLKTVANETNLQNYEKTIDRLRKGLEKAFPPSGPKKLPPVASAALAGSLQIVFDKIYGITLDVPDTCNEI